MSASLKIKNAEPVPTVTVLMATFNGDHFIEEQLASIRSQIGVAVNVAVFDDRSTDQTVETIMTAKQKWADFQCSVVVNAVRTGAAALNFFRSIISADMGDAEFVALSDQDDIWLPNKLGRAIERLKAEGTDAYASNLIAWDLNKSNTWLVAKSDPQRTHDHLFQSASAGCTYVMRRKAFDLVRERVAKLIDNAPASCSHDYLIYAMIRAEGLRWSIDEQANILYRQHDDNVFGAMPGMGGVLNRLKLIRSGWYLQTVVWTLDNIKNDAFTSEVKERILRLGFRDRWWLMAQVGNFRRKRTDQLALFLIFCLSSKT